MIVIWRTSLVRAMIVSLVTLSPLYARAEIHPVNLNGSWSGEAKCSFLHADGVGLGKWTFPFPAIRFRSITGADDLYAMEIDDDTPGPGGADGGYCGRAASDVNGRRAGAIFGPSALIGFNVSDSDFRVQSIRFTSIKVGAGIMKGEVVPLPWGNIGIGVCSIRLVRWSSIVPPVDPELATRCGES